MVTQTKTRIREWGNSLGVVIPKEIITEEGLKSNDQIIISITKKRNLDGFFGKLKSEIDSQEMKNESRKMGKMN